MPKRPAGPGRSGSVRYEFRWRGLVLTAWQEIRYGVVRLETAHRGRGGREEVVPGYSIEDRMPKTLAGAGGQLPEVTRSLSKWLAELATINGWLADSKYDDGKPVGLVTLTIRPKGALYLVQLRIQDHGGLICQTEDASLDDALCLLEAALGSPVVPWQRDPYPLGSSFSGKKK